MKKWAEWLLVAGLYVWVWQAAEVKKKHVERRCRTEK